ncbi:hypothetical protein QMZ92_30525 [Streptomyces sp. HNM0645]|uniref:hypothetical protein n=1 Tax=Streptomyces sp. HNM0645 TaxID=2782343 RepID=UPI0024B83160|nr:hypothetical protein [Streptomyces sp. HNM0645]MDI9888586.1 hypothetical protein [Streptomyces sp. HNM0645]
MSDLFLAPGRKVGGCASWHLTDPAPVDRPRCGTPMPPMPTVDKWECDGASGSWLPVEDRRDAREPSVPSVSVSAEARHAFRTCPTDPAHPHRLSFP